LYSVANVFADPPNYIDPAAPTVRAYKIKLIVDRVDPADITVSISPTEAVSGVNVGSGDDGPGVYNPRLATSSSSNALSAATALK
ncbi:MAG TPA: hypothetical protein VKB76_17910, partial [Ktedonobacterales bacterium]|nr:hypothetical protein [Ktedonobacterales bacterium]